MERTTMGEGGFYREGSLQIPKWRQKKQMGNKFRET